MWILHTPHTRCDHTHTMCLGLRPKHIVLCGARLVVPTGQGHAFQNSGEPVFMNIPIKSYHFESIDSTMNVAKMLAQGEALVQTPAISEVSLSCRQLSDLAVITADEQTAGRGRFSRHWYSNKGLGLYTTYLFSIPADFSSLSGFSLAVGVAVKRVAQRFAVRVKLKWPNDVVVFDKQNELCKLAGILIELISSDVAGEEKLYVSTGIGISLKQTSYPSGLMQKAISLEELSAVSEIAKEDLQNELNVEFWKICDEYFRNGFSGLKVEWEENSACTGMKIRVSALGKLSEQTGTMLGVDDDGSLLLCDENTGGTVRIAVGDVSLRMV